MKFGVDFHINLVLDISHNIYTSSVSRQGSNFTTATTANAVTSSAFAVMPFKFGF